MKPLTTLQIDQFNCDGYLLIKNAFSKEEIEQIRQQVRSVISREPLDQSARYKITVGDLAAKPELAHLTFDPRFIEIAKAILGPRLVYFGESNVMIGALSRGFHRDNADRNSPEGLDWIQPYQVIKFGIYCQDHARHSFGLKVRKGSHLVEDFIPGKYSDKVGRGKIYNIPSETGDLLVWSFKIAHSANFVRMKFLPSLTLDPQWEWKIPKILQLSEERERIVVFNAFGSPDPSLDRYIAYYVKRGDFTEHWKRSRYDQALQRQAETLNIEIRRPIPEYGSLT